MRKGFMLAAILVAANVQAQHEHHAKPLEGEQQAKPVAQREATTAKKMDMQHDMSMPDQKHGDMGMEGVYGPYPMSREASGTSWQPDDTMMEGVHGMHGPWTTMLHGYATAVYDKQGGPRGARESFIESMFMAMAQRPLGEGTLGVRGMFSLDPAMGKSGYPLLFQTGETADGRTPLVDRQHPHDFLMELAVSYSRKLSDHSSIFGYAGLPGEPALGPAAYMHRASGMDNPEAPLTHHWLDSTHITFGVLTMGYTWRNLKLEASAFNGREPDQYRWNMEVRRLDSASVRATYNPSPAWSIQVSHGRLDSPELLEPEMAVRRTTASVSNQYSFGSHTLQSTAAWGRNRKDGHESTNGFLLESALKLHMGTTFFGRLERVENDELFKPGEPLEGQIFSVKKLSLGFMHDFYSAGNVKIGAGALVSRYWKPDALDGIYGRSPASGMVFLRAKLAMR